MLIKEITETGRNHLWDLIGNNSVDYFFYIREYLNNKSENRFWIATKNNQFLGIMCLDGAKTVRMSGSNEVVENFLKLLDFVPRYINLPFIATELIPKYVKSEKRRLKMLRLILYKRDFSPSSKKQNYIHLGKKDMVEALEVFKAAEPEDWSTSEADKLPFDEINQWYGLRVEGKLTSVCWNQIYPHGGHIAFIATHPNFQNRGYATALVNFALEETFKTKDLAIIHVREDNEPALHTYRKIGYKDHLIYTVLCEPELKH
ncbi:MAG: GNAT family N-acetyltransferase [Candidatus Heimdallarchaeota archaeon]|nr:GNAT family N-acetyltransferase [Candidatus Heimdallarchaeota archaeon]